MTKAVKKAAESTRIKTMSDMGVPGYSEIMGYIDTNERNPALRGEQKWITASNILSNISIVSAGLHYFLNLAAESAWSVEPARDMGPNNEPSDESKRVAELVESCMYDMVNSWHRIVRRSTMFRFYGFAIQEWTAKQRIDGAIGIASLSPRPQHTIKRWDLSEKGDIYGVWQTNPNTFREIYLPRKKLVYLVDDSFTDSPEGHGLVRSLAPLADRYENYLNIEGQGFERDFRGIPIGYAPRAEINAMVKENRITKAEGQQLLRGLEMLVSAQAKGAKTGAVFDSSVYMSRTETGVTPSSQRKWGMELLTGSATGIEHVGAAIERCSHDMALILGVDGLLTGRDSGSRALSEDKSRHTYLMVNSTVSDIAEIMEQDFCGPILKLNGIDMIYSPTFKVEDVSFRSVSEITKSLADMAQAGAILTPTDKVIDDVRDMLGVSRQPDEEELAAFAALTAEHAPEPEANEDMSKDA